VAPDGAVWAASLDGLARYDGTRWSAVAGVPLHGPYQGRPWSVAADGTVFLAGPSGLARIAEPGR
jgi:ligand-binding sensor domain-containing protein